MSDACGRARLRQEAPSASEGGRIEVPRFENGAVRRGYVGHESYIEWHGSRSPLRRQMETKYDHPPRVLRPMLRAASFGSGDTTLAQILTAKQQIELGSISTEIAFNRGVRIYEAGSPADFAFIVKEVVVKAIQDLPTGGERVLTFLFAGDVCGLAQDGRYVNSVKAVTPSICFKIPIGALTGMYLRDSEPE